MSHFYGILSNSVNNERTLRGHKTNGISSQVKSWTSKCDVYLSCDKDAEKDVYSISISGDNIKEVYLNGKKVRL